VITADQLLAHAIGDYIIQSDWMATEKTKRTWAALVHVVTYTLVFLPITTSWPALAVICGTHFVIDRWRLARYVIWLRNGIWAKQKPWAECQKFGTPPTTPDWLAGWLHIFTDNILHVTINGAAIMWLS
jgi:hypothetical protein